MSIFCVLIFGRFWSCFIKLCSSYLRIKWWSFDERIAICMWYCIWTFVSTQLSHTLSDCPLLSCTSVSNAGGPSFWTGGRLNDSSGKIQWTWYDSEGYVSNAKFYDAELSDNALAFGYTNWALSGSGDAIIYNGSLSPDEQCLYVRCASDYSSQWLVDDCNSGFHSVIIEYPASTDGMCCVCLFVRQ